jgi:hypothetical protein
MAGAQIGLEIHRPSGGETLMAYLTLAYKGAHTDDLYTAYFDGASWHGNKEIGDQPGGISPKSDQNPGTCLFNNSLFLVYKGAGSNDLYIASYDGIEWSGDIKIKDLPGAIAPMSDASPSLAFFNGAMYAIYKGADTTDVYVAWYDGNRWSGGVKIGDQPGGISPKTDQGLSCCVFLDHLYIVHRTPGSNSFYSSHFDGAKWSGYTQIDRTGFTPASDRNPDLCAYDGRLYLTYKGAGSDDLYTAYFDGETWHGNTKIPPPILQHGIRSISSRALAPNPTNPVSVSGPESNFTPGTLVFNDKVYLVYKGAHSNELYTASFDNLKHVGEIDRPVDGATWHGNTRIADQPGGISPETNYALHPTISPISPGNLASWMGKLADSTLLCNVNLPGTHDSAAIRSSFKTLYACHYDTLSQQLEGGIRLLDIRIKIKKEGTAFSFVTCHGDVSLHFQMNEYQSLPSALDECKAFLTSNPSETVAMSLKIDDSNGYFADESSKTQALGALTTLLDRYATLKVAKAVTVGEARGKLYLLNRITADLTFGVPINYTNNTSGELLNPSTYRSFALYVQDQYEGLPGAPDTEGKKLDLFTSAWSHKVSVSKVGEVVDGVEGEEQTETALINFASGTSGLFGVYIQCSLVGKLGETAGSTRPKNLGWSLFDYEFAASQTDVYSFVNCVQLIIASNFQYQGFEQAYKLVEMAQPDMTDDVTVQA